MVADFVDRRVRGNVREFEEDDVYPEEFIEEMKALGFFGLLAPAEYGGVDVTTACFAAVCEELARGWMSLAGAIGGHSVITYLIRTFGTDEQQRKFLPQMATGELRATMALTEPGGGSDLQAMRTHADVDGDDFVVSGSKTWISNAAHSGLIGLLCLTDRTASPAHRGMSVLLAQPGEGVEVSDRTGSGPALPRPVRTTPTGTEEAARVNPGDLVVQVSTTPGVAGTPVGLRVSARQGRVTTATWSFGDRTPQVNGVEVSHTWVVPGSYRVSVRARLDNGRTGFRDVVMPVLAAPTATTTPTAPAPAPAPAPASTRTTTTTTTTTRADARPVASLSVSPRSVTVGDRVTANATRSRDDGTSLSYRIAWGDSSTSRPTNGTASHRYEKTGTYTVTLTVTDSARQRDTDTATVTVGEPPVWAGGHGKCYHGGAMDIDNDGTTDWSLGEDGLTLRGPGGFTAFAASQSDHSSSYTDCESASYERTSYTLEEHQWLRICLMTSGGRMSSVTVVQVPEDYYETMVEYDYVVW